MGLHNLESRSLADMMDDLVTALDAAQPNPWLDSVLTHWGSSGLNRSDEAEVFRHLLTGLKGLKFHFAKRRYMREADLLSKVIARNSDHPRSIFIELVDSPSMTETLSRYTVWKGVLFETRLDRTLVCWHPDKDYKPVGAVRVHRTGHSALGRRKRRKQAAQVAREKT